MVTLVKMTGTNKKRILIAVIGFIVVMLMLTVLSRVVASFAVVEVKATTLSMQTISETIEASTTAQMRQEVAVRTEPQQTIETFYVATGNTVNSGEPLFKVRTDDLAATITDLEEDRHLIQLRINILYEQITDARDAASAAQNPTDQGSSDEQGSTDQGSSATQNPIAQGPSTSSTIDELNYQLTSEVYERDNLDAKLANLYVLRDAGGVVHSPVTGTISEVLARVGDVTSQGAVLLIADGSAGSKIMFSADSTQTQYINSDTVISVTTGVSKDAIEGIELASVTQNPTSPTLMDVTLYAPAGSVAVGTILEVKITISSASYETCIPLSALHQTAGGAYVFVVDEEQSELGTEQVARIAYVTLVAQNGRWAAVEGLGTEQLVIVEATKMLTDKDRVVVLS